MEREAGGRFIQAQQLAEPVDADGRERWIRTLIAARFDAQRARTRRDPKAELTARTVLRTARGHLGL